jgi:hypothetical protein
MSSSTAAVVHSTRAGRKRAAAFRCHDHPSPNARADTAPSRLVSAADRRKGGRRNDQPGVADPEVRVSRRGRVCRIAWRYDSELATLAHGVRCDGRSCLHRIGCHRATNRCATGSTSRRRSPLTLAS